MPIPDDIDRDKIYTNSVDDADDDGDLELEPPDPEIVAAEERRAKEVVEATMMSVDIDEIYRESERQHGGEILEKWLRDFKFQFQVKHLLIATAVLAIVLTLWRLGLLGTALVLLCMFSVGGVFLYLQWQEKKQREEADRRRRAMYQERHEYFARANRARSREGGVTVPASVAAPLPPPPLPNETDQAWQDAAAEQKFQFRFQFSLKQLLIAMTTAAILLALVRVLGGVSVMASLLGFVALGGLLVHGFGYEPPEIVVLGWWLVLILYVALSFAAALWSAFT